MHVQGFLYKIPPVVPQKMRWRENQRLPRVKLLTAQDVKGNIRGKFRGDTQIPCPSLDQRSLFKKM